MVFRFRLGTHLSNEKALVQSTYLVLWDKSSRSRCGGRHAQSRVRLVTTDASGCVHAPYRWPSTATRRWRRSVGQIVGSAQSPRPTGQCRRRQRSPAAGACRVWRGSVGRGGCRPTELELRQRRGESGREGKGRGGGGRARAGEREGETGGRERGRDKKRGGREREREMSERASRLARERSQRDRAARAAARLRGAKKGAKTLRGREKRKSSAPLRRGGGGGEEEGWGQSFLVVLV